MHLAVMSRAKYNKKSFFAETLRLPSPRLREALHGPVLTPETRQDCSRRRVLRVQATQRDEQRREVGGRRLLVPAQHPEDASQRLHHKV